MKNAFSSLIHIKYYIYIIYITHILYITYYQSRIYDLNTTSVFANALFWVSGDNLALKHPANSCKQVTFAAGVHSTIVMVTYFSCTGRWFEFKVFFKIFICNTLLQLFTTLRIITATTTVVPFCFQGKL